MSSLCPLYEHCSNDVEGYCFYAVLINPSHFIFLRKFGRNKRFIKYVAFRKRRVYRMQILGLTSFGSSSVLRTLCKYLNLVSIALAKTNKRWVFKYQSDALTLFSCAICQKLPCISCTLLYLQLCVSFFQIILNTVCVSTVNVSHEPPYQNMKLEMYSNR